MDLVDDHLAKGKADGGDVGWLMAASMAAAGVTGLLAASVILAWLAVLS